HDLYPYTTLFRSLCPIASGLPSQACQSMGVRLKPNMRISPRKGSLMTVCSGIRGRRAGQVQPRDGKMPARATQALIVALGCMFGCRWPLPVEDTLWALSATCGPPASAYRASPGPLAPVLAANARPLGTRLSAATVEAATACACGGICPGVSVTPSWPKTSPSPVDGGRQAGSAEAAKPTGVR